MNRDQAKIGNDRAGHCYCPCSRKGGLLPAEPRLSHASGVELMVTIGKTCIVFEMWTFNALPRALCPLVTPGFYIHALDGN